MKDKNNLEANDYITSVDNEIKTFSSLYINQPIHKTYCRCRKCGGRAEVDTSLVLTSNPPVYSYYCPECGENGYIFCHDVGLTTYDLEYSPINDISTCDDYVLNCEKIVLKQNSLEIEIDLTKEMFKDNINTITINGIKYKKN